MVGYIAVDNRNCPSQVPRDAAMMFIEDSVHFIMLPCCNATGKCEQRRHVYVCVN